MQSINQTAIVITSKKAFSDAVVCLDAYSHSDHKSKSYAKVILLANSEINAGLFDFIRNSYQTICDNALLECTGGHYRNGSLKISYDTFQMWFHIIACEAVCAESVDKAPESSQSRSPIKGMLTSAEIYESMGLFVEAVNAYEEILAIEAKPEHQNKKSIKEQIDRLREIMTAISQAQDLQSDFKSEPLKSLERNVKGMKNSSIRVRFASLDKYSKTDNETCGLVADQQSVKNLMNEADLYRVHDLRREAWDKYNEILVLLNFNPNIKGRKHLSAHVNKMLAQIGDNLD